MPAELSDWSNNIPFNCKKYRFSFISIKNYTLYSTMSLLGIFNTSFASEMIPDVRCFRIGQIWMIICDIITIISAVFDVAVDPHT